MNTLTEIEDKLISDPAGKIYRQLTEQLEEAIQILNAKLREPNTPQDFLSLSLRLQSCLAAVSVVKKIWLYHHGAETDNSGNDPM